MKYSTTILCLWILVACNHSKTSERRIFDVHLHGSEAPGKQLSNHMAHGVQTIAISTSWPQQQTYQSNDRVKILHGLFVPCPNGKVPYSLQQCFDDGKEWPDIRWVEQQIKENKIDFIGEVLAQYHGISSSDSMMYPYYAIAEKYGIPVGIHTGSAGPNHGCPHFKEEMGNPLLLKDAMSRFPKLKAWLMHGGGPYLNECITMMKTYPGLYTDISVLNNPDIVPPKEFYKIMKGFIDAGLEDRLLFGSDNADIKTTISAVEQLDFLTAKQKEKIFHLNANAFFSFDSLKSK